MGKGYTTHLTDHELLEKLKLPPQHFPILKDILNHLIQEGIVSKREGKIHLSQNQERIVKGLLRVHPKGFAFLVPETASELEQDVFVPKHLTMNAVDGDQVEVLVDQFPSEKGPEGKVISILERSRTHIAGTVIGYDEFEEVVVYVPLLGRQRRVIVQEKEGQTLEIGDRIVMEVTDWGSKETPTLSRMTEYLGNINNSAFDTKAAIEEFSLKKDFPQDVLNEAKSFGKSVPSYELDSREDLRSLVTLTIDPDTAKDFDDALSLTKDKKGHYHLGVHIADVSHYVKTGSKLDKEAFLRCNSTYFPGFCLPMLPEELSNNLCSLKPLVNRLTVSVLMEFDKEGTLLNYRILRSVIKSSKRFTYKQAKKVLDGKLKSPHKESLQLMVELCLLFKKKRYERGSIEFAMPELVVLTNEKGSPEKTEVVHYDITHQLVEEFMLKANGMVAEHLNSQGKNLTYRIHDEPAEENLRDFSILVRSFGYELSDKPTLIELQKFFEDTQESAWGPYLATSFIRRMRMATYSPENIGHWGLALTHYCHFTSPIRRYVDLVVHRLLFGEKDEWEHLQAVALRCSEQERISAKAENSVIQLKKLRLLSKFKAEDPGREYEAVITRIKPFGFFFEVVDLMLEGFLHVSELESDYFVFDEAKLKLVGLRSNISYQAGTRITTLVGAIDLIYLDAKWMILPERKLMALKKKSPKSKTFKPNAPKLAPQPKVHKPKARESKAPKPKTLKSEAETPEALKKSKKQSERSALKGKSKRKIKKS